MAELPDRVVHRRVELQRHILPQTVVEDLGDFRPVLRTRSFFLHDGCGDQDLVRGFFEFLGPFFQLDGVCNLVELVHLLFQDPRGIHGFFHLISLGEEETFQIAVTTCPLRQTHFLVIRSSRGQLFLREPELLGQDLPLLRPDPSLGNRHLQRNSVGRLNQHRQCGLGRKLCTQPETSCLKLGSHPGLASHHRLKSAGGFDDAILYEHITDLRDGGVLRDHHDHLVLALTDVVALGAPRDPGLVNLVNDEPAAAEQHHD